MMLRILMALALLLALAPAVSRAQDPQALRWKKRVVIAFAAGAADGRVAVQKREVATLTRDKDDRDLVFVAVPADGGTALRRRYNVRPDAFEVLLIGKDGRVAQRSSAPIRAARLAATIDSMPMRQDEMRRAAH